MAATSDLGFRRGRHLAVTIAFAVFALWAMKPLSWAIIRQFNDARTWTPALAAIHDAAILGFAALAWLACTVFDTRSGVAVLPKDWRTFGVPLALWCVGITAYTLIVVVQRPAEHLASNRVWISIFAPNGDLQFGWLAGSMLAAAAAEEIGFRGLLLRALEGYVTPGGALLLQAVAFELVHAYIYGYGLTGLWFVGGAVLGHAFQQTRSLAVPTLIHAGHNILFYTLVWSVNR